MPPTSAVQLIQSALAHHQAGRYPQAEALYRQVLAQQPNNADALHLLGTLAIQVGQNLPGAELIERAIAVSPNSAPYYGNLGEAYRRAGQFDRALSAFRRALELMPDFPAAHNNLGLTLSEKQEYQQAMSCFHRAIALQPDYAEAYTNLGNALADLERFPEAIAAHEKALSLNPNFADACNNLGVALSHEKRTDEAYSVLKKAVALDPNSANAYNNLGSVLHDKGDEEAAASALRRAIAIDPNYSQPYSTLGVILRDLGQHDESLVYCRKAVALDPGNPEAHCNLANILTVHGQLDAAIAEYNEAVTLKPTLVAAHSNLGNVLRQLGRFDEAGKSCSEAIRLDADYDAARANFALIQLVQGDFESGWKNYESRLKVTKNSRQFKEPRWTGENLDNKTIFLHCEQGFGDTLMLARYAPLVAARCGKVFLEAQPELLHLLANFPGVAQLVSNNALPPPFDLHCPLASLPLIFETNLQSIPPVVPLQPLPELAKTWSQKFPAADTKLRIGLVWAGQPKHSNDRNRSIPLSQFEPLFKIPNIQFYSLQKGPAAEQLRQSPFNRTVIDWTDQLNDFADTAGLVANLDFIISVDTAVVHVAGTIGKPTWMLLPYSPDWRWLLDREDTPWYPSVKLFRQKSFGDWNEVFQRVTDSLEAIPPTKPEARNQKSE